MKNRWGKNKIERIPDELYSLAQIQFLSGIFQQTRVPLSYTKLCVIDGRVCHMSSDMVNYFEALQKRGSYD